MQQTSLAQVMQLYGESQVMNNLLRQKIVELEAQVASLQELLSRINGDGKDETVMSVDEHS